MFLRLWLLLICSASWLPAQERFVPWLIRSGTEPEWEEFAGRQSYSAPFQWDFQERKNTTENTLILGQRDVKHPWQVLINGRKIGILPPMDQGLYQAYAIPAGVLRDGKNVLAVEAPSGREDIEIFGFRIEKTPRLSYLAGASLQVRILEKMSGAQIPGRITITDEQGNLVPILCWPEQNKDHLVASRIGVVYSATGRATIHLPPGRYQVYAGRGFEYSMASTNLQATAGSRISLPFILEREVDTRGWVAADTHLHSLTHSGHGDATAEERLITIAGEGIELPIFTDHNVHADYVSLSQKLGLNRWFTPVTGNEVTTPLGHFNVFPADLAAKPINHQISDWPALQRQLEKNSEPYYAILNHPRDVHHQFQPFADRLFNAKTGVHRWADDFFFQGVEVLNSSAQQADPLLPVSNWLALHGAGTYLSAIGSSDSHDVSRYIAGQGRTYVAVANDTSFSIPLAEAVAAFRQGKLLVSHGLLVKTQIAGKGPGEMVKGADELEVSTELWGPSWTQADSLVLYLNGVEWKRFEVPVSKASLKFQWRGKIPASSTDQSLIVVGTGPALHHPAWPQAKPYQVTSPRWSPRLLGISNPIWIDRNGDGKLLLVKGMR